MSAAAAVRRKGKHWMISDLLKKLSRITQDTLAARLVEGERIVVMSRISKGIYWQAIAVAVLAVLVGLFVAYQLLYVLMPTAALLALYAFAREKILLLVLTNKRILVRSGLIQIDFVELRFDKIESLESAQMLTGFLMGYANLVVMGTGNRYINIPYVANAAQIRNKFGEMTLAQKDQ